MSDLLRKFKAEKFRHRKKEFFQVDNYSWFRRLFWVCAIRMPYLEDHKTHSRAAQLGGKSHLHKSNQVKAWYNNVLTEVSWTQGIRTFQSQNRLIGPTRARS